MKRTFLALILAAAAPGLATAAGITAPADPINTMCPIGKEPIVPSAGTVEYAGHTIGLCCPSCGEAFLAWDEARRDEFVALALRDAEPGQDAIANDDDVAASAPDTATTFPYPLDICVVTDEKLGSMGEPVVIDHEGREIKLCCRGCVGKFNADPAKYIEKIDELIVAASLMHYPLDICVVTGAELGSMGDPINMVYNNRLVRICCPPCGPKIEKDPAKYLAKIDALIVEQQVEGYPLDTCVVAGTKLGSMGDPVDHIHDNRLVRFCCASCIKTFESDPASYMAKLDTAYADAQRDSYPIDTCVVGGGELGSMGDSVEIVAGTRLVRFCCGGCIPRFKADPDKYLAKLKKD